MRKLLYGSLLLVLGLPPLLSLTASYYLKNHFIDNFAQDVQISQFDYNHGWFSSQARIEFNLNAQNTMVKTQNTIHHGPVIWSLLITKPFEAFSMYHIDSLFELSGSIDIVDNSSQKGMARTRVGYTGNIRPEIHHPGMTLRLFNSHIFADLPQVSSVFLSNGTILANFSANQIDVKDRLSNIYSTQPAVEISFESDRKLPSRLQANALIVSGSYGPDQIGAKNFAFTSSLEKNVNRYSLTSETTADLFNFNIAALNQLTISFIVSDLDEKLIAYISSNYPELSNALQNNQWLVLLKHFSQIVKHLNLHQPQLKLYANGLYADQSVNLHFLGKLVTNKQSQLNPFSILENLEMNLNANIPIALVDEINRPEISEFFALMSNSGLLISRNGSYHSKLIFQGAKLKTAHDTL